VDASEVERQRGNSGESQERRNSDLFGGREEFRQRPERSE
jgi:hypothetical protein